MSSEPIFLKKRLPGWENPEALINPPPAPPVGTEVDVGQRSYLQKSDRWKQVQDENEAALYLQLVPEIKYVEQILKNSKDPNEDMDRLMSSAYMAERLNIPLQTVYENHDIYNEEYWGRVQPARSSVGAIRENWKTATLYQKIAMLSWQRMSGNKDPLILEQIKLLEDQLPAPDIQRRSWPVELMKSAANMAPYMWENFKYSLPIGLGAGGVAAAIGAGAGGVSIPGLFGIWFQRGMALGSSIYTFQSEAGLNFYNLVKAGIPEEVAATYSIPVGAINSALEQVQLFNIPGVSKLLGGIKSKLLGAVVKEGILDGALDKAAKLALGSPKSPWAKYLIKAGKEYVIKGMGVEAITEVAQEASNMVSEYLSKAYWNAVNAPDAPDVPQATKEEAWKRLRDTYLETVKSMMVMGLGGLIGGGGKAAVSAARGEKFVAPGATKLGEPPTATNVVRDATGLIQAQYEITTHTPEGDRGRVVAGDPATGQTYAYALLERTSDSVEILGLTTLEGFEDAAADLVKRVAADNVGKEIIWNPTEESHEQIKAQLIESNPRGAKEGLQWFSPEGEETVAVTRELVKTKYQEAFQLTDREAEGLMHLADIMAKRLGISTNQFVSERWSSKIAVRQTVEEFQTQEMPKYQAPGQPAAQVSPGAKGVTQFYVNGQLITDPLQASRADLAGRVKAVVHAFETADYTTAVHEFFHVIERHGMDEEQTAAFERLLGDENGPKKREDWDQGDLEKLAYDFEKYLATGEAPSIEVRGIFQQIADAMRQFIAKMMRQTPLTENEKAAYKTLFTRMEGTEAQAMSDEEFLQVLTRPASDVGIATDFTEGTILEQVKPSVRAPEMKQFLAGLSPEARATYDFVNEIAQIGVLDKAMVKNRNAFARYCRFEEWNDAILGKPQAIISMAGSKELSRILATYFADPEIMATFKSGKDPKRSVYLAELQPRLTERFASYLKGKPEGVAELANFFDRAQSEMQGTQAAALKVINKIPQAIRTVMRMQENGTIKAGKMEQAFVMERSLMQRVIDALPMETMDSAYFWNGKKIMLTKSGTMTVVGGEAYRRALHEEYLRQYKAGTIQKVGVGSLGKDEWGAMGFLGGNSKTLESGDFTTLCPQVFFNKGCWYCYRRAALETGVNNKLVGEKVWYTGEILRLRDKDVQELNLRGGLRVQSFGDWMDHQSPQFADMLADADLVGLQVKVITKEPSMIHLAAMLKRQGLGKFMYFNISTDHGMELIGPAQDPKTAEWLQSNPNRPHIEKDGKIYWKRALSVAEGYELKKRYPWVNVRTVAVSVREFIDDLEDPRVQVVTGYHGWKTRAEGVLNEYGEVDAEIDAMGDKGMPRFNPDGSIEYAGKTEAHKKLAQEIFNRGLQHEYLVKACCIHGRCDKCAGICGLESMDDSLGLKNGTNLDADNKAAVSKQAAILEQVDAMHGTAYEFDKFRMESVGSGEGAAAFGWGMYFTTAEKIARHYADVVKKRRQSREGMSAYLNKMEIGPIAWHRYKDALTIISQSEVPFDGVRALLNKVTQDIDKLVQERQAEFDRGDSTAFSSANIRALEEFANVIVNWQDKYKKFDLTMPPTIPRVLYNVTLLKENFLGWYDPITEEHKNAIQQGLIDIGMTMEEAKRRNRGFSMVRLQGAFRISAQGGQVYKALSILLGSDKKASKFLLSAGIDGIRYPTGTLINPAKGKADYSKGTNWVAFDVDNIQINSKLLFQVAAPTTSTAFKNWFGESKIVDKKGKPKIVFHNTEAENIDAFRRGDLGMHFGTITQAEDIIRFVEAPTRLYQVYLRMENPLRLRDMGAWGYGDLARANEWSTRSQIDDLIDAGILDEGRVDVMDQLLRDGDPEGANTELIDALKEAGYDGIIYLNRREGVGGDFVSAGVGWDFVLESDDSEFKKKFPKAQDSYMVFDPEQIKSVDNTGGWSPTDPRILYQTAAVESFVEEIDDSVNPYLSEAEKVMWERWVNLSDHEGLRLFMMTVTDNEDYYEALQANLKRMGLPDKVIIYKGKEVGKTPVRGAWGNGSLSEATASRFRKLYGKGKADWAVHAYEVPRESILAVGSAEEAEVLFSMADANPIAVMPALFQIDPADESYTYNDIVREAIKYDTPQALQAAMEKEFGPELDPVAAQAFYKKAWEQAQSEASYVVTEADKLKVPEEEIKKEEPEYDYLDKFAAARGVNAADAERIEKGDLDGEGVDQMANRAIGDEQDNQQAQLALEGETQRLFEELSADEKNAVEVSDQLEDALTDFEVQQQRIDELTAKGKEIAAIQAGRIQNLTEKIQTLTKRLLKTLEKNEALAVKLAEQKTRVASLLGNEMKWRIAFAVNEQREIDAFRAGLEKLKAEKKLAKTEEQRDYWRQKSAEAYLSKRQAIAELKLEYKEIAARKRAALKMRKLREKLIKDIRKPLSKGVAYKFFGEAIERLRSGLTKEKLKLMTTAALEAIDQQISVLRKAGRAARSEQLSQERTLLQEQILVGQNTILRGIAPRRPVGTPAKTPWLLRTVLPTLKPDRIALFLDGGQPGFFTYWLQDRVNNAWSTMQQNIRNRISPVSGMMDGLKLTADQLDVRIATKGFTWIGKQMDIDGFVMDNKRQPTIQDAMYWYIGMRNEKTRKAILFGNRIPEATVRKGIAMLTDEQKALADAIAQDFEANFGRLRDAFIERFNMDLPAEVFYVPMRRLQISHETRGDEIAADLVGRNGLQKEFVARNPTYPRLEISEANQKPIRTDLINLWMEGVRTQEGFIWQDLLIKRLHSIMESDQVTGAIIQKYGNEPNKWIKKYINDLAQSDAYSAQQGFERIFRIARSHVAVAYLGFNLLTASKQLVSSFGYLGDAGPLHMAAAAAKFAAGQGRNLEGQFRPFSNRQTEWVESKSEVVRSRSIGPQFEELKRLNQSLYQNITRKLGTTSMKLLEVIDKTSVVIGWTAVYDKVMQETGIEEEAIRAADAATVRTQPSGRVQDMAAIYRMGDAAKWFTMFTSELNVIWNRLFDITQVGKSGLYARAAGDLISIAMAGLFIAVAGGALSDDDPEKRKRKLLLGLFTEYVDAIPFFGSIIWNAATGQYGGAGIEIFPAAKYFGRAVAKASKGDVEATLQALVEASALTLGVPMIGPKRAIKAVTKGNMEELLGWK